MADVVVHPQLHRQDLLLADDIRHLPEQHPQPFIGLGQLFVFLLQLILPVNTLRHISGGDLGIGNSRPGGNGLLDKAQGGSIREAKNLQLRIQTADGIRRGLQGRLQLRQGLDAAPAQLIANGQHPVVD